MCKITPKSRENRPMSGRNSHDAVATLAVMVFLLVQMLFDLLRQ